MNDCEGDEQFMRKLLKRKDRTEALSWVTGAKPDIERNVGELSISDSVKLIQDLYSLGAKEVFVVDITKNGRFESTDTLVIVLPDAAGQRRRLFRYAAEADRNNGVDPDVDFGQAHLMIWFD